MLKQILYELLSTDINYFIYQLLLQSWFLEWWNLLARYWEWIFSQFTSRDLQVILLILLIILGCWSSEYIVNSYIEYNLKIQYFKSLIKNYNNRSKWLNEMMDSGLTVPSGKELVAYLLNNARRVIHFHWIPFLQMSLQPPRLCRTRFGFPVFQLFTVNPRPFIGLTYERCTRVAALKTRPDRLPNKS